MWRSLFSTTFGYSSSSEAQPQQQQEQQDWWIETAHHDDSLLKCYSFTSSSSFVWRSRLSIFDTTTNTSNIIGQGSFGVVRKCQNVITGEWCACKSIVKQQNCGGGGDDNKEEDDLKQAVQREVQNLQRITRHPHLIELYGVWEDTTHVHIVTELCTGGELYDLIVAWKKEKTKQKEQNQAGLLPSQHEAQCACLLHDSLQAIQYLHEAHHMAHRDLKASNFLLTSTGQIKIIDFGLSRVVDDVEVRDEESAASTSAATTKATAKSIHRMDRSTGSPGSTTTATTPQPTMTNSTTSITKVSRPQQEEDPDGSYKDDDAVSNASRAAACFEQTPPPTTAPNNEDVAAMTVPTTTIPATTCEDGDDGGAGYRTARSSFQAEDNDDDDDDDMTSTISESQSHNHSDADIVCQRQPLPRAITANSTRSANTSLAYLSAASSSMFQHDDEQQEEKEEPETSPTATTTEKDIKTLYGVMTSEVGTPFFVAPEVLLEDEYTYLCDIWSIGVIAYLLLSQGHFPLDTFDERTSIRRLMDPQYTIQFPAETWSHVSSQAQDFCAQLLQKDPSQRPTARQALQHSWIRQHISNSSVAAATDEDE